MSFLIPAAYADAAAPAAAAGPAGSGFEWVFLIGFLVIFYLMIWRPQAKRAKEHRNLMSSLSKGDEVLTSGGLVGKIAKVSADSDYIVLALNDQTQVTIKRDFVSAVLPKGSIQSL